jgi:predicted esterase
VSPRGKVMEGGAPRFFRRLSPGVFDLPDLALQTDALAAFVDAAAKTYHLDRDRIIAVGFSNGANIAASLLLKRGAHLRGAVLLSPMLPFEPEVVPDLKGVSVFIGAGEHDPMASRETVERLESVLREAGATVTMHWTKAGHSITKEELAAAQEWMVGVMV